MTIPCWFLYRTEDDEKGQSSLFLQNMEKRNGNMSYMNMI